MNHHEHMMDFMRRTHPGAHAEMKRVCDGILRREAYRKRAADELKATAAAKAAETRRRQKLEEERAVIRAHNERMRRMKHGE